MTDQLRQAALQALEAIQSDLATFNIPPTARILEAIAALEAALEQPQQEPVAELSVSENLTSGTHDRSFCFESAAFDLPAGKYRLYTAPQPARDDTALLRQEAMSATQPIYCYSLDGEEYHGEFDTREAALAEAEGEAENEYSPGETVKIYTGQQVHAMHFLRGREARIGESIVEQLDEWLIDDIYSEEPILELFKEQHAAFGKHILDWLEVHGSFSRWSVGNVQEHEITLPKEGGPA